MAEPFERDFVRRLTSGQASAVEVESILRDPRARRFHVVRRALAAHARTPRTLAMEIVPTLFWRDLASISADVRVHPEIRRAADREILRRLPGLALSERIELAAAAGRGVVVALRAATEPQLIAALMKNPFVVEADLVTIAVRTRDRETLNALVSSPAWGSRPSVRAAYVRNPAAPLDRALLFLEMIPIADVRELVADGRLSATLRVEARRELARRLEGHRPLT